jgi:hypothetical protein
MSETILNVVNFKINISGFVVYKCNKHGIFFRRKDTMNKKCPYKNCNNKEIKKLYDI